MTDDYTYYQSGYQNAQLKSLQRSLTSIRNRLEKAMVDGDPVTIHLQYLLIDLSHEIACADPDRWKKGLELEAPND